MPRPTGRRLNTQIPGVVAVYNKLLEHHCMQHNLLGKIYQVATSNWTNQWGTFAAKVESLDRVKTEGMAYAEKRCRRLHTGAVFFSPELDLWYKRRRLFSLVITRTENKRKVRRSTIIKLARKCGVDDIFAIPLEDIKRQFREADHNYRALKPKSADLREQFLREQLTMCSPSTERYKYISSIFTHERQRSVARFLRQLVGSPSHRKSVTEVEEVLADGTVAHACTQEEVEDMLRRCLEQRFRLTNSSPMMPPDLFEALGNGSLTLTGQHILQGSRPLPVPAMSNYTPWLLEGMSRPSPPLPPIEKTISPQDFQRYWRRAKERTSSSVSGLHFGHYKAAASSAYLSELHSFFTEIVFRTGYPLKRWQQGLQVILEKKPGVILVSKLRAILLMEADFNFGNKLFVGSRMLANVQSTEGFPSELYGGIKGRRVEYMALGRLLLADTLRQKRCVGAIASVDAQACYDRITHSVASLCCQRLGVPARVMETMLTTIQGMKFFLRTGYGDSTNFYGGGQSFFQGICQGKGAGPAVWLAISTVLVLILHEKIRHQPLRGAISSISLVILALLFVDDTDLILYESPSSRNHISLLSRMQALLDLWQGLLHASGGSLSAEKCSWCLVAFRWKSGQWVYHTSRSLPATMYVKDDADILTPIRRVEPKDPITVVGVEQSMDGSMRGQVRALQEKVDKWSRALNATALPRHLAWAALQSKIWPSLRFPCCSTTLTRTQSRQVMGRLYRSLLPRMGVNRHIAVPLRHGSLALAGLDLPDLYLYQGSQQVAMFLQLYGSETNEGHLLRVSLEHLQLEVGIGAQVLSSDFATYGFLATPSWLTSLWEFISFYRIKVVTSCQPPPICRQNDSYIIEALLQEGFSREEVKAANRCRLHLQLLVFSDLATGSGKAVQAFAYEVKRNQNLVSSFEWPNERPSRRDKQIWQHCLRTYLIHHPLELGSWIAEPHCPSPWWFDEAHNRVYHLYGDRWLEYAPSISRSTRSLTRSGTRYKLAQVCQASPPGILWHATVQEHTDGRVSLEGFSTTTPPPLVQTLHPVGTMSHLLDTWNTKEMEPLLTARFPDNGRLVAQAVRTGTAHGACDGSYMPSRSKWIATAAWILEDSANPGVEVCSGPYQWLEGV